MTPEVSPHAVGVTLRERLLQMPLEARIRRITEVLRQAVAHELGIAPDAVATDVELRAQNPAWQAPNILTPFLDNACEANIGARLRPWQFWQWLRRREPLDTIERLAVYLSTNLVCPPPETGYSDVHDGGTWAWEPPVLPGDGHPKCPTMAFVLAAPRSGSTLFRSMLDCHPDVVCGAELYLLPFETMATREQTLDRLGYPWMRLGLASTIASLAGLPTPDAWARVQQLIGDDAPIPDVYRMLQGLADDRLLVDKTPYYPAHPAWMARAEALFEEPRYLLLTRHPYGVIESFVRMRFDELFGNHSGVGDANPWLHAEKLWAAMYHNAITFLADIAPERQLRVRYEDLVREPQQSMQRVCAFLSMPYDPAVVHPYERISSDYQLGDPNLRSYSSIDPSLADAWRSRKPPLTLSPFTREVAARLGYEAELDP